MLASHLDEETVLGSLMDGSEAVIAAEHVLLYKDQLGDLILVASHTQEARAGPGHEHDRRVRCVAIASGLRGRRR